MIALAAAILALAAASTKPVIEFSSAAVAPRDAAVLVATVPVGTTCTLTVTRGDTKGTSTVKARQPVIEWRWSVGPRAAPGFWSAQVKCKGKTAKRAIQVVAGEMGETGSSSVVRPGSLRTTLRASVVAGVVGKPQSTEAPFPPSESVWLANERRPDIIEAGTAAGVAPPGSEVGLDDYSWDAWHWSGNAQRAGLPVGSKPAAGAIVVFPQGAVYGAFGHVGYVTGVNADGSFNTEERGLPDVRGRAAGRDKTKVFTRRAIKGTRFVYAR